MELCRLENCEDIASKTSLSSEVALTELVELGYRSVVGHLLYWSYISPD